MSKSNANGTDGPNTDEPSENDPCMGSSDKTANFFVRFRSEVCERWRLSHKIFYVGLGLISVIVILFIIVICLAATWPRIPHSHLYPVCKDAECLRAASQVRESMNSETSPCTDLWSWACGGWLAKYPLPKDRSLWDQRQQLVQQEAARVRDLIATLNLPVHSVSVEWKLKHLYEACLNVDNVNNDKARPLTEIIAELGGWYILRDWSNEDFDAMSVLKKLHVRYGVTPFFKITVEPDPYSPGQYIIRISPPDLGLPDREYYYKDQDDKIQNAYKELVCDVVRNLGATRNDAEKFGNDIFHYEKRIAEIIPTRRLLQNPLQTCNHRTISELKETITTIPFYDILTALFPEANINETTEVVVTSVEYLSEISQIIATTPRQTMNGYLVWTLVRRYLPFLSQKFTSVVDNFNAELLGVKQPLKRWEVCANLVNDLMGFAVNALNEKSAANNESHLIINEAFRSILKVVNQRIKKFQTMSQLYQQLKRKLSTIQLQIGFPENLKDSTYLKDYYSQLQIIRSTFFVSVKHGIVFKNKLAERLLTKALPENVIIETINRMPPQISYCPSRNLVVVPKSILSYPYFENKYPRAIIYGRVGVQIAHAILSAILPYDSFWTSDGKLFSPYHLVVNDSLSSINTSRDCLHKNILSLNLDLPYNVANEAALLTLKQVSAVSIANEALKSFSNKEHVHQPTLEEHEDSSLFFLSYAQTQCSESTDQFQYYNSIINFEVNHRSLLHIIWSQLPEFSESVGCSFDKKQHCPNIF